jgi:hypothetical protein
MKKTSLLLLAALWAAVCSAATPPAEKLLPQNTLAVLTVPDGAKLRSFYTSSPQWQMWQDPAMRPFKEKFAAKFKSDVSDPLAKQYGVNVAEYADLAQGQITLAWVSGDPAQGAIAKPVFLLLIDTKDRAKDLRDKLAGLKKKWADANTPVKTEQIRGVEFNTITVGLEELLKLVSAAKTSAGAPAQKPDDDASHPDKPKAGGKFEILFGQSDSLLIVGNSSDEIGKVLTRQSGGSVPGLDEDQDFQSAQNTAFRDAPLYFWLNLKPLVQEIYHKVSSQQLAQAGPGGQANPAAPDPEKILSALGLKGLKSFRVSMKDGGNGKLLSAGVSVEPSGPQGLFKLFAADPKESRPPDFVPADVETFFRYRLDLQKTWNGLEKLLREVYPPFSGALDLVFSTAGKDKDKDYDLRKELIGNLGDDLITFQTASKTGSTPDAAAPSIALLISSPNGEKLLQAVRTAMGLMSPVELKEREFLGRKVYSPAAGASQPGPGMNLAASAGYLAFSTTPELVEGFIRSSDTPRKSLREVPGLNDAADKVGGMQTGLFGYDNQIESLRASWDAMRKNPDAISTALAGQLQMAALLGINLEKSREWVDFSLLPPFDSVSPYLTYSVYAASFAPDGVTMKVFYPDPPGVKK